MENCATKRDGPIQLNFGQTIAFVIILVFVLVAVLSSTLDIIFTFYSHKYRSYLTQITECFSLRQNITKFFDTSSVGHKSHTYNLQFIDGIKVLSMLWVIIGHTYISGAIFFNKDIPTANFYCKSSQFFSPCLFNELIIYLSH